jgi:hypothetical protein
MANVVSSCADPARIATCLFRDLDLPSAILHCVALFCYARVMAWRSLFEVRLNACFCYINQGKRCHRSKYRGSFDFSTADEVVAHALLAAAVISSIVCDKTAGRGLARTKRTVFGVAAVTRTRLNRGCSHSLDDSKGPDATVEGGEHRPQCATRAWAKPSESCDGF